MVGKNYDIDMQNLWGLPLDGCIMCGCILSIEFVYIWLAQKINFGQLMTCF